MEDSVVSWLILMLAAYYGFFRLFAYIINYDAKKKRQNSYEWGNGRW